MLNMLDGIIELQIALVSTMNDMRPNVSVCTVMNRSRPHMQETSDIALGVHIRTVTCLHRVQGSS